MLQRTHICAMWCERLKAFFLPLFALLIFSTRVNFVCRNVQSSRVSMVTASLKKNKMWSVPRNIIDVSMLHTVDTKYRQVPINLFCKHCVLFSLFLIQGIRILSEGFFTVAWRDWEENTLASFHKGTSCHKPSIKKTQFPPSSGGVCKLM